MKPACLRSFFIYSEIMQKPLLLWHSRLIPLLQKGAPYCLLPGQSLMRMESEMKSGHPRIGLFLGLTLLAMFAVPLNAAADNTTPNPLDLCRSLNGHLASANTFSMHIEKQFDVVRLDGAKVEIMYRTARHRRPSMASSTSSLTRLTTGLSTAARTSFTWWSRTRRVPVESDPGKPGKSHITGKSHIKGFQSSCFYSCTV